jgi:hypothetical protein
MKKGKKNKSKIGHISFSNFFSKEFVGKHDASKISVDNPSILWYISLSFSVLSPSLSLSLSLSLSDLFFSFSLCGHSRCSL